MAKFTITATIVFEVEAESSEDAAVKAFAGIEFHAEDHRPENIQVWDSEPGHWFADRYTYANPPVLIAGHESEAVK
ncbi:hypothetical protein SEA_CHASER_114 [Mycobacterium phage Chaser]|nr:hypothetical protein SEA_CHASER_114 [Mycobacterium phage Chaser]